MSYSSKGKIINREIIDILYIDMIEKMNNDKLVYVGLPGRDMQDIKAWRKYLKRVIAIEHRGKKNKREIAELCVIWEEELAQMFDNDEYEIYINTIESFINGRECIFNHRTVEMPSDVSLFNFDYCNEFFAESEIREYGETGLKTLKHDAINTIISQVRDKVVSNYVGPRYAVLLLTFNRGTDKEEIQRDLNQTINEVCEAERIEEMGESHKWHIAVWCLISSVQNKGNRICYQAPSSSYTGDGGAPMQHSIVLIKFDRELGKGSNLPPQNCKDIENLSCCDLDEDNNESELKEFHQGCVDDAIKRLM